MIITKQNLEQSYKPVVFYWECGKKKEEWVTSSYEGVEYSYKQRIAEKEKYKVAYGNENEIDISKYKFKERLGKEMHSLIFYTNKEKNRLFVAFATMKNNTRRGEEYVPYWEVDKDKYYEVNKNKDIYFHQDFYNTAKATRTLKFDNTNFTAQSQKDLKETFEAVFGENLSCKNRLVTYENDLQLTWFLETRCLKMSEKNKDIFYEYISEFGTDRRKLSSEYFSTSCETKNGRFIQIDKNPKGKYLFRFFVKYNNEEDIEIGRSFDINGRNVYSIYDCDRWIKVNYDLKYEYLEDFQISEEAVETYKYKLNMLNAYKEHKHFKFDDMYNIISQDVYEKIFKLCSTKMFNSIIDRGVIDSIFGCLNENSNGFYSQLGISRELFEIYDKTELYNSDLFDIFRSIKFAFRKNNIADMSSEIFSDIIKIEPVMNRNWFDKICDCVTKYVTLFECSDYKILKKIYNSTFESPTSRYFTPSDVTQLYDYYSVLLKLKEAGEDISNFPKLPVGESLSRYHDMAVGIFNSKKNEIQTIEFSKQMKKRKWLEYSNENFSLILPRTSTDILNEGATLHHCVGGYVDRVRNGNTTIIFLRKNADIDDPFYTIEVNNENHIVQIHGFGNKFIGNNPETISFVVDWIKKNKLTYDKRDILSDGKHYGEKGHLIENVWGL